MTLTSSFVFSLFFFKHLLGELVTDNTFDEEINIFSRQLSEIDQFGVERSPKLFMRRPELDLLVKRDLFWRDETMSRLEKAVAMLEDDLETNQLLREAWEFGNKERPEYSTDPLKMAALVYTMSDQFPLYKTLNEAIAGFTSGDSYTDFHFKGFYALLLLSLHQFEYDLYMGVSSTLAAEKDMYIRFNRFSSSTTNFTTAMNYATKKDSPGTILIFKGRKNAAQIDPFSYYPDDDEYLIEPESQFRVIEVADGNSNRIITLERAYYPWPSYLPFF